MNRVVRLGDLLVRQGVLAVVCCCAPICVLGQQQKAQDQSVPDAPTPQEPDSLGNLTSGMTPGKGSQDTPPGPRHEYHPGTARHRQPASLARTRYSKRRPKFPHPENAKGPCNLRHPGQLRHCAGHGAGQETSTSGRADLARFSNLREQHAPAHRFFQRRRSAALRCPGHRPKPAPGHHEEGER